MTEAEKKEVLYLLDKELSRREFCESFAIRNGCGYPAKSVVQQALDLWNALNDAMSDRESTIKEYAAISSERDP